MKLDDSISKEVKEREKIAYAKLKKRSDNFYLKNKVREQKIKKIFL